MYTPTAFAVDDENELSAMIRACPLATFVTATPEGPMATPVPMFLDSSEGEWGVLYAHLARPNPQWQAEVIGQSLAIFMGPDAYITPSWYASKGQHGKVVPTWNYTAVHASGPVEFFHDSDRLLDVVGRLTDLHESTQKTPWSVTDAPEAFIGAQLRGIVGLRMPITRMVGKKKLSQNRPQEDRLGVRRGLTDRDGPDDAVMASLIPL